MLTIVSFALSFWKPILIGLAVAAVVGWIAWERNSLIQEGVQQETQQMEKANAEELARAQKGADTVDGCYATGGDWSRELGVCQHPTR